MLREGYWNQQRRGEDAIDRCRELWNEMDAVDCERENILCRDSALLKKNDQESIQQKPLEWEYNNARYRESNAESARSRRLDDIHNRINQGPGASLLLLSVKKLLLMRHKYRARLFKDKRTATGTNFHSVAIKIRFRPAFRCTPRMLLPPPPLDGLLTDSTNYGCKWCPPTFVAVSAKCFVSNFELAVWISNKDKN
jgi:hypothetical protein